MNQTVPLFDLKAQYQALKAELDAAVARVLGSGAYAQGREVAAFEAAFASYCGVEEAIAVNSGTSALHLALLAADIGPGDEVITVPLTFVATVAAIRYTGARPVFVDVDPMTLTLDPRHLDRAVTSRTKAIVPVHLYGQPADMDPILRFASRRGLLVIEDAAQAHGAEYRGRRTGSLGHLGCFSFYPTKTLGACGEGGAITTASAGLAKRIRSLRDWGAERKYQHTLKGFNYRMDEIQAAILQVKLPHLDGWIATRAQHAAAYDRSLVDSDLQIPATRQSVRHAHYVYVVMHELRDALQRELASAGIQTGVHYPVPVHKLEAHADLGYVGGDFPAAESACRRLLSLPLYPELTSSQLGRVIRAIRAGLALATDHTSAATA